MKPWDVCSKGAKLIMRAVSPEMVFLLCGSLYVFLVCREWRISTDNHQTGTTERGEERRERGEEGKEGEGERKERKGRGRKGGGEGEGGEGGKK